MIVVALALVCSAGARAQAPYDDAKTPAGWAWAQLRNDKVADFDIRCGQLDPHAETGWNDACRQLPARFLMDILTVPKWRDQLAHRRVRIRGARIDGALDLADADVAAELALVSARIDGSVILADSHWQRPLSLAGSVLNGALLGANLVADSAVRISDHAAVSGNTVLSGARIGALDMDASSFAGAVAAINLAVVGDLQMGASFRGPAILRGTTVGGNLTMAGAHFTGSLQADNVQVRGDVFMTAGARVAGAITLMGAKIGGNMEAAGASFAAMDATALSIGRDLLMDHSKFGDVTLMGAKVGGNLQTDGSAFAGGFDATGLGVGGDLLMDHATFAGDVTLMGARIGGNLQMDGSAFSKVMDATGLSVGGDLFLDEHATFGGDVTLSGARVGGDVGLDTTPFSGAVTAVNLDVKGDVLMGDGATFRGDVNLTGARLGAALDLRGATAWRVNLAGASAQELRLGRMSWWCGGASDPGKQAATHWRLGDPAWLGARCNGPGVALPSMILRNAHVDAFQDSVDAWPPLVDLEGFHYERIGGLGGEGRDDMRRRPAAEWADWIARDRTFSTQPYAELSGVLQTAGNRDTAEAIQFAGREGERREAWVHGALSAWVWLSFLGAVAGYGIGLYTFRVLWWVFGLTLLGALVLRWSPYARSRGRMWRLGASLHRLLPVIELNKEFKDFFDNPEPAAGEPRNLNGFLAAFFSGLAIAGWILGFFLLAAMSGLTQKG